MTLDRKYFTRLQGHAGMLFLSSFIWFHQENHPWPVRHRVQSSALLKYSVYAPGLFFCCFFFSLYGCLGFCPSSKNHEHLATTYGVMVGQNKVRLYTFINFTDANAMTHRVAGGQRLCNICVYFVPYFFHFAFLRVKNENRSMFFRLVTYV